MSCALGLARSTAEGGGAPGGAAAADIARRLRDMQAVTGRVLAVVAGGAGTDTGSAPDAGAATILSAVETALDALEGQVRLPSSFVVPGESRLSAEIHHARSVCRRAERSCVAAGRRYPEAGHTTLTPVLNRLSDYLFVLALYAVGGSGRTETV